MTGDGASQRPDLSLGDRATRGAGSGAAGHDVLPEGCVVAGRYTLGAVLGRGGMGVVHRAQDSRPRRPVALKFLAAQGQAESAAAARFLAEAETIARLAHLNILQVYDVGEWVHEGRTHRYIAMELVEGGSLRDHLRDRGKLAVPEACALMRQVGQALAYAHRQGVIHRDLKPANVLLTKDGVPKLADFGLAKGLSESELSVSGFGLGTVGFMSPEQRRDAKSVDHRTDIYAWGATLYQVVTGRDPLAWDPDELPAGVSAVVRKCLKDRAGRYFSMEEALAALASAEAGSDRRPEAAPREAWAPRPCAYCEADNTSDARFCESCGAALFEKCSKCGTEGRSPLKFCRSCGLDVARRARYFAACRRIPDSLLPAGVTDQGSIAAGSLHVTVAHGFAAELFEAVMTQAEGMPAPAIMLASLSSAMRRLILIADRSGTPVRNLDELPALLAATSGADEEIARATAAAIRSVGSDNPIVAIADPGTGLTGGWAPGVAWERGWASFEFVTEPAQRTATLQNPAVLLYAARLEAAADLIQNLTLLEQLASSRTPLLLVAHAITGAALGMLVINHKKDLLRCCAVSVPEGGSSAAGVLEDLAAVVGSQVAYSVRDLGALSLDKLGRAEMATVGRDSTVVIGHERKQTERGRPAGRDRVPDSEAELRGAPSEVERDRLATRTAALKRGVFLIRVGGASEELRQKRVDATRAAARAGLALLRGGGVTLGVLRNELRAPRSEGGEVTGSDERVWGLVCAAALRALDDATKGNTNQVLPLPLLGAALADGAAMLDVLLRETLKS